STVFVVDDDQAVGEAIADLLQENGYSVQLFTDGAAFLEAGSHGCLLVDALMPGMSGIALIKRLKSDGHDLPAHRNHGERRRADGGKSDEGGSCGFHREAGRSSGSAREYPTRA